MDTTLVSGGTIEDHLSIQRLIYQYAIAVDSLDKVTFEACYAPGALAPDQAEAGIEYHRQYAHTMHNVQNHLYRVQGREAQGVAYCVASMVKDTAGNLTKFDVYLMYRDELVKLNDQWFFVKRALEIIFSTGEISVQPGAPFLGISSLNKPGSFRELHVEDAVLAPDALRNGIPA